MNKTLRLKLALHKLIGHTFVYKFYSRAKYALLRRRVPNAGYSEDYYKTVEGINEHLHPLVAEALIQEFHPQRLVDVGCGAGGISFAFFKAGVKDVVSFDYSHDAVGLARQRGLPNVSQLDLTTLEKIPATGDLCICLEVAEHLPGEHADRLCRLLSEVAPTLAFTAAPPGQGGHLHVNEQPQSYWITLMAAHGMAFDPEAVARIRAHFAGRMIPDYDANLMVFRRRVSEV